MGFSQETELPVGATRKGITSLTRYLLWSKSGGRCQICNKLLYKSALTQRPINIGEVAHIISAEQNGPRGDEAPEMSEEERASFDNLMLLCAACHHEIDKNPKSYPAELLRKKKRQHEVRIELVTGIDENNKTWILLYSAPINELYMPVDEQQAYDAVRIAGFYPAKETANDISCNCKGEDRDKTTWTVLSKDLEDKFKTELYPQIARGGISHVSVFALGPMPLLVKLGALLTDKFPVLAYQRHRISQNWVWPDAEQFPEFTYQKVTEVGRIPVIMISLSGKIQIEKVREVLGDDINVWELTLKDENPNVNCIINKNQLINWRIMVRTVLEEIKMNHSGQAVRVFPAMPVSTAIEFGRARLPKVDLEWIMYDFNKKTGSYIKTLTIK